MKEVKFEIISEVSEAKHFQQDIELLYVLKGKLEIVVDEGQVQLGSEGIFLINSGRNHTLSSKEDTLLCKIRIPIELFQKYLNRDIVLFFCNSEAEEHEKYNRLREILYKICGRFLEEDSKSFYKQGLYYQLLGCLTEYFLLEGKESLYYDLKEQQDERINKIIQYIHGHFQEDISLNELSDRLFLSVSYVSRYFKKVFGVNFKEYVNQVRLQYAVEELLNSDKSITRIAVDNGFTNASVFHKKFSESYGISPTKYRNEQLKGRTKTLIPLKQKLQKQITDAVANLDNQKNIQEGGDNRFILLQADQYQPYHRTWQKIINAGSAQDLLQAEMQEHIKILHKNIQFKYIRFWNLFVDKMQIQEYSTQQSFNFYNLDLILDFLIELGIKPFLNLGFQPKQIHYTIYKPLKTEDETEVLRSREEYGDLIRGFIRHIIARYSPEEVQTWKFEVWNNETQKWRNEEYNFFSYFEQIWTIMKEELPGAQVGGCGSPMDHYKDIIKEWQKQKYIPDFLSFYCYPYRRYKENGKMVTKYCTQDNYLSSTIKELKKFLKEISFCEREIYFTEWNSTISSRSYLNDSCWKGAYLVKNMIDTQGMLEGIGYWLLSDIYSNSYDCRSLLNGGTGLVTREGLAKPACYALHFLSRQGNYLIGKGRNYIATTNGKHSYYLLCHNYRKLSYRCYMKEEHHIRPMEVKTMYEETGSLALNFRIQGVTNKSYVLKIHQVNEQHGSILDEWLRFDCDENITKDEIRYIKQVSGPALYKKKYLVEEGKIDITIQLQVQEFVFVHISEEY